MSIEKACQLYEDFLNQKKVVEARKTAKFKAMLAGENLEDITDLDNKLLNLAEFTAGAMYDELRETQPTQSNPD